MSPSLTANLTAAPAGLPLAMVTTTGACKYLVSMRYALAANGVSHSLGYGKNDKVTFANNYIHHTSGRSPKVEFANHWHAYNNYWYNNSGHAFDVGENSNVLIEGNVFAQVDTPSEPDSGKVFAATSSDLSACKSALGRNCVANSLVSSGNLTTSDQSVLSDWPSGEGKTDVMDVSKVASYVVANAGVGKLGGSASASSTVGAVSSATPSASASMVKRFGVPFVPAYSQAGPGASSIPALPSFTWKTVGTPKPTLPAPAGFGSQPQAF